MPSLHLPKPDDAERAVIHRWQMVVVVAVLAIYANSLAVPFLFDDPSSITDNDTIRSVWRSWSPPKDSGLTVSGRPVLNFTLALNYAVGGAHVAGYHVGNILLHLATALALLALVRETLALPRLREGLGRHRTLIAGATALLWACHPLQTESVTYVIQRAELLVSFFYVLTLYGFVRAVQPSGETPGRWLALSAVACAFGMGSKEVMVTAPLAVFAFDLVLVSGSATAAWRARWKYYLGLAATWVLLAGCIIGSGVRGGTVGYIKTVSAWSYLATQCEAIAHYLQLTLWPHPLVFDYGRYLVGGFHEVVLEIGLLVVLAAGIVYGLLKRAPLAWVGGMVFLLLSPTSSVVPVLTQTMAEHRMYLALAPVVLLVVLLVHRLAGRRAIWWVSALAVVCACLTIARNRDYRSAEVLWRDTAEKRPQNARVWTTLAMQQMDRKEFTEAKQLLARALLLDPDDVGVTISYAQVVNQLGETAAAEELYRWAIQRVPKFYDSHYNLGTLLLEQGRADEAAGFFKEATRIRPESGQAHYNLGNACVALGRLSEAIDAFRAAISVEPGLVDAHANLAAALIKAGQPQDAIHVVEAARPRFPAAVVLQRTRALALGAAGRTAEALKEYQVLVQQSPGDADLRADYGLALASTGAAQEAVAAYREALRLGYGSKAPAKERALRVSLGELLASGGKARAAAEQYRLAGNLAPTSPALLHQSAQTLLLAGLREEAASAYEEILRDFPPNADLHNDLGVAYLQLKHLPEARRQFEAALRLRPDFPAAQENLKDVEETLRR